MDEQTAVTDNPWSPKLLIRASAGSGKTHRLSTRLIAHLLDNTPLESILAVTFTRKAAGEIRDRVFVRLAKAYRDDSERAKLITDFETSPVPNIKKMLGPSKLAPRLRELVQNQHRLNIATLDGFFSQLARTFGFELSLPSGWRLCDPFEEDLLRTQAIRSTIESLSTTQLQSLMHMLSKDELRTNLMSELDRITSAGYFVYQGTQPHAWDQPAVPASPEPDKISAAIQRLEHCHFRTEGAKKAFQKHAELAISGQWVAITETTLAVNLNAGNETFARAKLDDPELVAAARVLNDRAKTALLGQLHNQTTATYDILDRYHQYLTEIKRQRRLVTFDDLAESLASFLGRHVDSDGGLASPLLHRLDAQVRHLLLDEFQDTAPTQWRVIEPFLRTALQAAGSLFCVGDTKQAIYGWRGGQAELFDALSERVPGLASMDLAQSYRSSPVIMDAVNRCFTRLGLHPNLEKSQKAVSDFAERFPEHRTARTELPGYVVLETAPEAAEGETIPPSLLRAVEVVRHWRETRPHCQVGVLTRSNKPIGIIISLLRELGIEASQEGGNPLIDSPAVELVLSALQLADHPGNPIPAFHLRHSPLREYLGFDSPTESESKLAQEVSRTLRLRLTTTGLGRTVSWLVQGFASTLPPRDQARLAQLVDLAHRFRESFRLRADDFVNFVHQERVAVPADRPVSVMTIHKAKGLEFDAVVLPDLQSELIGAPDLLLTRSTSIVEPPQAVIRTCSQQKRAFLSKEWQEAYEKWESAQTTEALCVGYVAMTRARQALQMIIPASNKNPPAEKRLGSLLAAALKSDASDATKPGTVLFELGDRDWTLAESKKTLTAEIELSGASKASGQMSLLEDCEAADRQAKRQPLRVQLGPRRMRRTLRTPSQQADQDARRFSEVFASGRRTGEAIGSLIHLWFAEVEWWDHCSLTRQDLERLSFRLPGHLLLYVDVDHWATRFLNWMQHTEIVNLLKLNRYRQGTAGDERTELAVRREASLSAIEAGEQVSGRVDRLVVSSLNGRPVRAEIIDFKTDALGQEDILDESLINRHRTQLDGYRTLVAQHFAIRAEHITCSLAFLSRPVVVTW